MCARGRATNGFAAWYLLVIANIIRKKVKSERDSRAV